MAELHITGTDNLVDQVDMESVNVVMTSSTSAMLTNSRITNATVSGNNLISGNWIDGQITVSTGTGLGVIGNYAKRSGTWLSDSGTFTRAEGNAVICASTTAKPYNFTNGTDYAIDAHVVTISQSTISTGAGTTRVYLPFPCQAVDARATISTLTSSTTEFIIDVNISGNTMYTTGGQPVISTGTYDSGWVVADSTAPVWRASSTDYVTVDVDTAGTGAGLIVQVRVLPVTTG